MEHISAAWQACIDHFLQQIKNHSGSEASFRMYTSCIRRFVAFVNRPLSEVTRADVLGFLAQPSASSRGVNAGQPVKASTRNVKLSAIQSLFTFASSYEVPCEDGSLVYLWPKALPTVGLRAEKKDIRPRQMSEGQLRSFWGAIPDTPRGRRDRCLFYCFLILGRRRAELLRLTWGSIQPAIIDGQPSHTYNYTGKGASRQWRQKELPQDVYAAICRMLQEEGRLETIKPEDPIFQSSHRPGQPLCGDYAGQIFRRYALISGMPSYITLHSLRWSSVYHRVMNGASVTDARDLLDHSDLSITGRYLSGMISTHDTGADALARQFAFLR